MALQAKRDHDYISLLASMTLTASANGSAVRLPGMVNALVFVLDVTADESTAADKLDVYIQTKIDGTNWVDVVHFTQHAGNAGAKRYISKIISQIATAEFENGTALGAAAVRNILGDEWRVKTVIVDDSASASFTFSVTACPM